MDINVLLLKIKLYFHLEKYVIMYAATPVSHPRARLPTCGACTGLIGRTETKEKKAVC